MKIKFRTWFPGPNVMGKVTNLKGSNVGYEFNGVVAECFIDGRQVFYEAYENFALMQYTGLEDKNGKEIYEGDIMILDGRFTYDVRFEDAKFVCYHLNTHGIKGVKWGDLHRFFDPDFAEHHVEVIGNIYQNPELLNQ